ncbi:MAG: PSD1 and planctomycete cytochrome C domain-containing protein [Haloferula sp.]
MLRRATIALGFLGPTILSGAEVGVSFNRDIRPILSENCFHCHGPDSDAREAGLRLDTFEGAVEGGDGGPAIVPGKAGESLLLERVHSSDPTEVMPPRDSNRSLSEDQKKTLKRWINEGAEYEPHWAYVPPKKTVLPAAKGHPVDYFVRRKLQGSSLEPSPEAAPEVLIRRLSLDLIGIPPSPDEVGRFLEDFGADPDEAYKVLVDRLLASKHFGERWARPWLDLARYADSNGFQADQLRDSWPYRDWVIDAMNSNQPFDQFTIEQIAGDLLPEPTLENRIATGFHRTVPCNVEAGVDPEENRVNQVVDRVNTTATVWLAMTLECAQCHDHKYDALSMEDYYSFYAFFNNTPLEVELPSNKTDVSHDFVGPFLDLPMSAEKKAARASVEAEMEDARQRQQQLGGKRAYEDWLKSARSALAVGSPEDGLPEAIANLLKKEPGKVNGGERKQLRQYFDKTHPEWVAIRKELEGLEKKLAGLDPDRTLVMEELSEPRETRIFNRGNYLDPRDPIGPGTPKALPGLPNAGSEGLNRLDLARWLVDRGNPLTARVAVNRWWAELFGHGLVATLEDFGTQSEPPTHPELLDWLAVELMETGWDRKHLIRLMVMSNTYRQSSKITPENLETDPDNRLYARASRFRLNAERIRDNALAFSGLLSPVMHGPPVMPYQPPGVWRQVGRNEPKWVEARDLNRWRRGIYVVYRRAAPYPSMVNFDAPDRAACTVSRARTNTPLQALTLLNDPAYVEMAVAFADRVLRDGGDDLEKLDRAFLLALSRKPQDIEKQRLMQLLAAQRERFSSDSKAVNSLLDAKSIAYQPEHHELSEVASWFFVTSTILNLDESMTRP